MNKAKILALKLKSDSFWVALGFAINAISSLVIGMLLTRILNVQSVGLYFLAFSVSIMLSGIIQFGLNVTVVRLISASVANNKLLNLRSILIKLLFFIVILAGGVALCLMSGITRDLFDSFQDDQLLSSYIYLVGWWVFFTVIRSYIAEVFRGFQDIKLAALYQRILPNMIVVLVLLVGTITSASMDLSFVLYLSIYANAILVFFSLYPFIKKIGSLPSGQSASIKPMLFSSTPIAFGQIFQFFVTQTPLWVLAAIASAEDVADYGVAFRLAAIISLPLLIANNVIMPHVSKYHANNNKKSLIILLQYAVTLTSLVSFIFLFIYIFMGEQLLILLYGPGFNSAYLILLIISCGHVMNVLSGSPAVVLAMACKEEYVFYSSLFAAIATLLFSFLMVFEYGVYGAAIATAFGLIFLNLILVYFSYKTLGYKTFFSLGSLKTTFNRVTL